MSLPLKARAEAAAREIWSTEVEPCTEEKIVTAVVSVAEQHAAELQRQLDAHRTIAEGENGRILAEHAAHKEIANKMLAERDAEIERLKSSAERVKLLADAYAADWNAKRLALVMRDVAAELRRGKAHEHCCVHFTCGGECDRCDKRNTNYPQSAIWPDAAHGLADLLEQAASGQAQEASAARGEPDPYLQSLVDRIEAKPPEPKDPDRCRCSRVPGLQPCLLDDGHEGDHEWSRLPDKPEPEPQPERCDVTNAGPAPDPSGFAERQAARAARIAAFEAEPEPCTSTYRGATCEKNAGHRHKHRSALPDGTRLTWWTDRRGATPHAPAAKTEPGGAGKTTCVYCLAVLADVPAPWDQRKALALEHIRVCESGPYVQLAKERDEARQEAESNKRTLRGLIELIGLGSPKANIAKLKERAAEADSLRAAVVELESIRKTLGRKQRVLRTCASSSIEYVQAEIADLRRRRRHILEVNGLLEKITSK